MTDLVLKIVRPFFFGLTAVAGGVLLYNFLTTSDPSVVAFWLATFIFSLLVSIDSIMEGR